MTTPVLLQPMTYLITWSIIGKARPLPKGQAIGKSQAHVLDGKSKQVTAVAKSDFNIIQK